jgi:hypothetical protein
MKKEHQDKMDDLSHREEEAKKQVDSLLDFLILFI